MRFFLDNDVPVSVGKMLAAHGHRWWTAAEAGMADESQDDNLSVYSASKGAVLVTLDREFMRRRRKTQSAVTSGCVALSRKRRRRLKRT